MSNSATMLALVERIGDDVRVMADTVREQDRRIASLEASLAAAETKLAGYGKAIGQLKQKNKGSESSKWRRLAEKWLPWIAIATGLGGGGAGVVMSQQGGHDGVHARRGAAGAHEAPRTQPDNIKGALPVVHGPHAHPPK